MKILKLTMVATLILLIGVTAVAAKKTRVALVMPGVVTDQSWNQFAYEGLMAAKNECDLEVAYSEKVSQDEQVEVFRQYALEGYDIIIGHGGEYAVSIKQVAGEFPNIEFGNSNGFEKAPNLSNYIVSFAHMGYVSGCLAGMMTKTGKVAEISAMPLPIVKQGEEAFKRGVKYVNPSAKVTFVTTGSWEDVTKAREAALALIADGHDVLTYHLDTAEVGVISACEDKGVYAIGTYRDVSEMAPKAVIGSALGSPATLVHELACGRALTHGSSYLDVNSARGGVDMACTSLVPKDIQKKMKEIVEKMRAGKIDVTH
jgi:basic membrane protein A